MSKAKRVIVLILSAITLLLFGLSMTTVKNVNASVSESAFSWVPGASARVSDEKSGLRFRLKVDKTALTSSDVISISVEYCTGEYELEKTTVTSEDVSDDDGYVFIKVELSGPTVDVQLKASINGISKLSDIRSQLYVLTAAYKAGDEDYSEYPSVLAMINSNDNGFITKVKSQEFVKIYEYQTELVYGTWDDDSLDAFNQAVFDTVVSNYFSDDVTYRIEEIGNDWNSLQGCYLYFTWKYNSADYGITFYIKSNRKIETTVTGEFDYSYDYFYEDSYFYLKFNIFSSFDKEKITDFKWRTSKGTAVYMSMLEFDETSYTTELNKKIDELTQELYSYQTEAEKYKALSETQKADLDAQETKISNLETEITEKANKIETLENKKADLEKQIEEAEKAHDIDTANITALSSELETVKSSLNSEKKELVEKIAELNVEVNTYKSKVTAYEKAEEERKEQESEEIAVGCTANVGTAMPIICIIAVMLSCIILGGKIYARKKR